MRLEDLKSASAGLIAKLEGIGVKSVEGLIYRGLRDIGECLPEVRESVMRDVFIEAWRAKGFWFMTGDQLTEFEKQRLVFPTGSKNLDALLGGGAYSMSICEFWGEYGVGKSQILFTIMVEGLEKHRDGRAVFLDSENTYRDSRIREIAEKRGYNPEDITERIIYIPVYGTEIFREVLSRIYVTVESRNVKLILSDSLIAPLRAEYLAREMLAERQQELNRILRRLLNLARIYNLAVVISNQAVAIPVQTFAPGPLAQVAPTGGHIMGHITDPRVFVRKAGGTKRIARIIDSSWLPEGETVFRISERGVEDP